MSEMDMRSLLTTTNNVLDVVCDILTGGGGGRTVAVGRHYRNFGYA